MKIKEITNRLVKISKKQDLIGIAKEHLMIALENFREEEEREYKLAFGDKEPKKIKAVFYKQSLIFKHVYLEECYMDIEFRLTGKEKMEIGSYRLITDLKGNAIDDYLVFEV